MVLGLVIIGAVLLDVTRESMAVKARRKEAAAKGKVKLKHHSFSSGYSAFAPWGEGRFSVKGKEREKML